MGGVADYSGSLVLECATTVFTTVEASLVPDSDALAVSTLYGGEFTTASVPLNILQGVDTSLSAVRDSLRLQSAPAWMYYVFGSLAVFVRETGWKPPVGMGLYMDVKSTVPASQGVSSSASVSLLLYSYGEIWPSLIFQCLKL